jgi:hypothetical protein
MWASKRPEPEEERRPPAGAQRQSAPGEGTLQALPSAREASPVHPLPLLTAYAAHRGLVRLRNHSVPTELEVAAGTVVRALGLETLRGRRPLYRLAAVCAPHDPAWL